MSVLVKAARAVHESRFATDAVLSAETVVLLAKVGMESLPRPPTEARAWEVTVHYASSVFVIPVVSSSESGARVKVIREQRAEGSPTQDSPEFTDGAIRSVHLIDAAGHFADIARQIALSSRQNVAGYYDIDPTLLAQARRWALLVVQQLG